MSTGMKSFMRNYYELLKLYPSFIFAGMPITDVSNREIWKKEESSLYTEINIEVRLTLIFAENLIRAPLGSLHLDL